MFKQAITVVLVCIVPWFCGCRQFVNVSRIPNKHVETWPIFDPNDYGIQIEKTNGTTSYQWNRDIICQDCPDKFTVILPYWGGDWIFNKVPTIQGQINGTSYPAILDTGNPIGVLITDIHINRQKLPVFFFHPDNKSNSGGLVIVNELTLGRLRLEHYPCHFPSYHVSIVFLGLSTDWWAKTINFPLDFISSFSYVQYDQIKKELSLSSESFTPADEFRWITFPFEITDRQIHVPVSIEGIDTRLFLDTGSGGQLSLDKKFVQQLFEKRPDLQRIRKKKSASLSPYIYGKVEELKFTAKKIRFNDFTLNNVTIRYSEMPPDKKTFPYQGTIGIDLFKNTVVVLDFEKKLIWVEKMKGSLFEP